MDPMSTTSWTRPERLSRTRGDGPEPLDAAAIASQAPPHPRGWTRSQSVTTSPLPGSPAPAGMDPPEDYPDRTRPWLPRTRGDGPADRVTAAQSGRAPPHPRGWTQLCHPAAGDLLGSPAPAGMDPHRHFALRPAPGLPRTRGDGPLGRPQAETCGKAPPHPRGWTLDVAGGDPIAAGSPAPAGMDLIASVQWTPRLRLPRTRGDGPPGVCGCCGGARAPPHPRGWTRPADPGARPAAGSPAPAGMDPQGGTTLTVVARLPRTRGDGPVPALLDHGPSAAPPHPRGWTQFV